MKKIFFSLLFLCFIINGYSQKTVFITRTGQINFDAGTGLEDIKGINKSVISAIDINSGQIQFSLMVQGFEFKSQLMQDHFNENYMETEKFPKSVFKGSITNVNKVNFVTNGTYNIDVKGILEIHGIKKEVQANGSIKINNGSIIANSTFTIKMGDFGIIIPGVVSDKLSKDAKINVNCTYNIL